MAVVTFRCPNTGLHVHVWMKGEDFEAKPLYETVTCIACQRMHLVSRESGRVVGGEYEE